MLLRENSKEIIKGENVCSWLMMTMKFFNFIPIFIFLIYFLLFFVKVLWMSFLFQVFACCSFKFPIILFLISYCLLMKQLSLLQLVFSFDAPCATTPNHHYPSFGSYVVIVCIGNLSWTMTTKKLREIVYFLAFQFVVLVKKSSLQLISFVSFRRFAYCKEVSKSFVWTW